MKNFFIFAFTLLNIALPTSSYALSFAEGTVFIDADTESECKSLGGEFMEWANETFCTQTPRDEIPSPFSDIPSKHENAQAIDYMKTQKIIGGYPDGTFQAKKPINRAELTKVVVAFNYDESEIQSCDLDTIKLLDVSQDAWYAPYICLAKANNIVKGYDDGTFKPAQNVNLAEASKIMGKGVRSSLSDGNDIWFRPYMEYFSNKNALPTTLTAFNQNLNRGQVSEMLFRVKARVSNKESLKYGEGALSAPEVPETTTPPPLACAACPEGTISKGMTDTRCGTCEPIEEPQESNAEYLELNTENLEIYLGKRKIALFFHADWCPSCRTANTEIAENIKTFPNDTVVLKANFDTETKLREKFGITQQHSVVIINKKNEVVQKLAYGFTIDQLKLALK